MPPGNHQHNVSSTMQKNAQPNPQPQKPSAPTFQKSHQVQIEPPPAQKNEPLTKKNQPKTEPSDRSTHKPLEFLKNFLPRNLYNPETKKILGILTAEDLLLVALIFLFMEDGENSMMALVLLYVLLSEYIDLGDFPL